jgi:hypothetical protein
MNEPIDTDDLRRLLAAATPGEWEVSYGVKVGVPGTQDVPVAILRCGSTAMAEFRGSGQGENAELAVAAVNALPALLARLRAAEAGWSDSGAALADSLLERARLAEAHIAALTEARNGLVRELRAVDERFVALETAVREVIDDLRNGDTTNCPTCGAMLVYQEHGRGCSLVALAALLDDDAPPTDADQSPHPITKTVHVRYDWTADGTPRVIVEEE